MAPPASPARAEERHHRLGHGPAAAEALAPAALAGKNDWTAIPPGETADSLKGDAVLSNGRIVAVLRKQDSAVEVHAVKPGGAVARLRLRLMTAAGEPAARLERMALVENTRGAACLEATFKTAKGARVTGKFRIKRGDVAVQAEPGTGAGKLRVECPGRFGVLPDFFADDITIDATRLPLDAVELPSENFVLHLTGEGDAIAMCVFENRQQDVKVTLSGAGDRRIITGSEIGFEGKKIWVALLEAPKIWHTRELKPADTGKVIPLDWKMPFPAQWRVDFTRSNDLTDSWEMLLQEKKNGKYIKPSWLGSGEEQIDQDRNRWNTVLGTFPYPCWSDPDRRGYLQPLKSKVTATPRAGGRLPDQPGRANAAGCLHGGGRDAQHPGCRPVPAHPRHRRAEIRVQGEGDLRGARHAHPHLRKARAESRNVPRSKGPSTMG